MEKTKQFSRRRYTAYTQELQNMAWEVEKKYNCTKKTLIPHKGFLKCNCSEDFKLEVTVDACLSEEIESLWEHGIHTTGCCCGHGKALGYIGVIEEDIPKMKALGYQQYIHSFLSGGIDRKDSFIPKSYGHEIDTVKMYVESGY